MWTRQICVGSHHSFIHLIYCSCTQQLLPCCENKSVCNCIKFPPEKLLCPPLLPPTTPPLSSRNNEVSLFQIGPVKLYIVLKHGTDTIILRPTCTSGVRMAPSPTYPHSKRCLCDSLQMIYTNKKRPQWPPTVTSQSEDCSSTDLMAVSVMKHQQTSFYEGLTHVLRCSRKCVCEYVWQ